MNFKVKTTEPFEKQVKRLLKKYPSLKEELLDIVTLLKVNPVQGTIIGKNCYKLRMSIASKGKGKSGGARIITHFVITHQTVYLLTIYDKAEKDNISDNELKDLLQFIPD
ncbi:MAG: type II toxin-antitoxin system RelE/ParE family toxin [Bacteroidota bacterium]